MNSVYCEEIFEGVNLWRPEDEKSKKAAPGYNFELVRHMFVDPHIFFETATTIKTEGGRNPDGSIKSAELAHPVATEMQLAAGWAAWFNAWLMVIKHRQAKMSTFFVLTTLLRDCMYIPGYQGVLIANSEDTVSQLFDRLVLAYDHLMPQIKVPCSTDGKSKSVKYIHFIHGGSIQIMTGKGDSIGSGWSPDRVVISELGEMDEAVQDRLLVSFIPSVRKRPHARVIIETTPGMAGTPLEEMWHLALAGTDDSMFSPLFLCWLNDDTCKEPVTPSFVATAAEKSLMACIDGMTLEHARFRRRTIASGLRTAMNFDAKFPNTPYDGWRGADRPIIDADLIQQQLLTARADSEFQVDGFQLRIVDEAALKLAVEKKHKLLTVCDSNKPGAEGDPSALTLWDKNTMSLLAFWSDREEPELFASRAVDVANHYGCQRNMLVFEGNSGEAFTVSKLLLAKLPANQRPPLYVGTNGRGWWASDKSLQRAHGRLMKLLRDGDMVIGARSILHQFLHYDGNKKKRMRVGSKSHHFDLARTVAMAADLVALQTVRPIVDSRFDSTEDEEFDSAFISISDTIAVSEDGQQLMEVCAPVFTIKSMNAMVKHKKPRPGEKRKLPDLRMSATLRGGGC